MECCEANQPLCVRGWMLLWDSSQQHLHTSLTAASETAVWQYLALYPHLAFFQPTGNIFRKFCYPVTYLNVFFISILCGGCCQPRYLIQLLSVDYLGSRAASQILQRKSWTLIVWDLPGRKCIGGDLEEQNIYLLPIPLTATQVTSLFFFFYECCLQKSFILWKDLEDTGSYAEAGI